MKLDPNQLAALAEVLRLGSFDGAAQALSVTPSAVSQRIKALEDRVGAVLIRRGVPCTGTAMGLRLAKHSEDMALLEAKLKRDLALDQHAGPVLLRVAVNADSLATWFLAAMARVPGYLFDLVIDDQDHSADWLRNGEVSAAICALPSAVSGCDSFDLGCLRYIATASPAYMADWFPDGVTPQALEHAPMLTFDAKDALQQRWLTRAVGTSLSPPTHFLPSSQAFVDAAKLGLGWGMNPVQLVQQDLRDGQLVELLPNTALDVRLTWQVNRIVAPALKPLTESVRRSAKADLIQE
ncbi:MAG: LysR family transcriptional regulator ArgP [Rhodobacteraceae bacterium]|nr:LysR family transcriptional regulator ArgP [Paracoccaceae bacterium]